MTIIITIVKIITMMIIIVIVALIGIKCIGYMPVYCRPIKPRLCYIVFVLYSNLDIKTF